MIIFIKYLTIPTYSACNGHDLFIERLQTLSKFYFNNFLCYHLQMKIWICEFPWISKCKMLVIYLKAIKIFIIFRKQTGLVEIASIFNIWKIVRIFASAILANSFANRVDGFANKTVKCL